MSSSGSAEKDWKQNLLNRMDLIKQEKFRHDLPYIKASDIGGQFFCEMKVDLDYVEGRIESQSMIDGTQIHDEVIAMEKTTVDKIIENIESGGIFLAAFTLISRHDDLVLCGIPDAIVFKDSKPVYIIELKTATKNIDKIYDGQLGQATVYSFLLEEMGFDCSQLTNVIVKVKRPFDLRKNNRQKFLYGVVGSLFTRMEQAFIEKSKGSVYIHTQKYKRSDALEIINKIKGYWMGEREPTPTTNPNKCRSCSFKTTCKSSLA